MTYWMGFQSKRDKWDAGQGYIEEKHWEPFRMFPKTSIGTYVFPVMVIGPKPHLGIRINGEKFDYGDNESHPTWLKLPEDETPFINEYHTTTELVILGVWADYLEERCKDETYDSERARYLRAILNGTLPMEFRVMFNNVMELVELAERRRERIDDTISTA